MPRSDHDGDTTEFTAPRARKPWAAFLLSVCLPGLGHLYAGRPDSAWKRFALVVGVSLVIRLLVFRVLGAVALVVGALVFLTVYLWVAVDASRLAASAPRDYTPRSYNRWYVYVGIVLLLIGLNEIVRVGMHAAVGRSLRIQTGAMEPTLLEGDWVFTSIRRRQVSDLRRGTIVVYRSPDMPNLRVVMRVVGLPGDTLAMYRNVLLANGVGIDEPYVITTQSDEDPEHPLMVLWQRRYVTGVDTAAYRPTLKNWGPLVVPPDSVFVLGDNRDRSYDSRYFGFVGGDRIDGRPTKIYFSYDPAHWKPLPYLTAIRWDRIGLVP